MNSEHDYPKWEELTNELQTEFERKAFERLRHQLESMPPPTHAQLQSYTEALKKLPKRMGRSYYNRLTRPAVMNYIDDYADDVQEKAKVISAKAKLTNDAIGQLSSEIVECKKRILDISFGLDWHSQNMPGIHQQEELEQWQTEADFSEFIKELLLVYWLETERSALQNPNNKDELAAAVANKIEALKKKWFLADDIDSLIEKIRPFTAAERGKGIYKIILALQKNKQLKHLGDNEVSELHYLFGTIFRGIGSREALNAAKISYEKNPKQYYKKGEISQQAKELA